MYTTFSVCDTSEVVAITGRVSSVSGGSVVSKVSAVFSGSCSAKFESRLSIVPTIPNRYMYTLIIASAAAILAIDPLPVKPPPFCSSAH